MKAATIGRIHRVTALTAATAVVFWQFFDISKHGPFRDINPFGDDPYDAVGSFAFQVALLVGILTYARALRLREVASPEAHARLILRGNVVALAAILVTLVSDAIAEIVRPFPPSYWGNILLAALVFMFLLALCCAVALAVVFRRVPTAALAPNLTPADGLDDLWTLVRVPVSKAGAVLPHALVQWVERLTSDRVFARFPWVDPRRHPWRFGFLLSLLAGVGLAVAHLQEGLPPSFAIFLLITAIFVSFESTAAFVGFATLGGFLGLRPSVKKTA